MTKSIDISLSLLLEFILLGAAVGYGYCLLLLASVKKLNTINKKGVYLFLTTIIRLGLFVLITFILTKWKMMKLLPFILGFMVMRSIFVFKVKKGKVK